MVIINDAAISAHLGHYSTAHASLIVFVSWSGLSLYYKCRVFHTVFIVLHVCICTFEFLCIVLFAQLQTQHSALLMPRAVYPDNCTQYPVLPCYSTGADKMMGLKKFKSGCAALGVRLI